MLWTALIMGLAGSAHCALMCGPLVLAVPVVGQTKHSIIASRLIYQLGRISTYAALGLIFGAFGKTLFLAGFQDWLSIGAGAAMLLILLLNLKHVGSLWKGSLWIKSLFSGLLKRRSYTALFVLGLANGLLPCGLVYVAATASIAAGSIALSALYMAIFGLGTLPVLLGIALSSTRLLPLFQGTRLKPLVPVVVSIVALSLILRGLSLGIPYVSPSQTNDSVVCPAC